MKYSEIVSVEKHFKSAFDITSDSGEAWKTFISNERFENNLSKIINSFTSPAFNKRKSIWIQGTYGTGKSHSLSVIKHLKSSFCVFRNSSNSLRNASTFLRNLKTRKNSATIKLCTG